MKAIKTYKGYYGIMYKKFDRWSWFNKSLYSKSQVPQAVNVVRQELRVNPKNIKVVNMALVEA